MNCGFVKKKKLIQEPRREIVYLIEGKDATGRPAYWTGLISKRADNGETYVDFNYDAWYGVHFHVREYANAAQRIYPELSTFTVVEHAFIYVDPPKEKP